MTLQSSLGEEGVLIQAAWADDIIADCMFFLS